MWLSFPRRRRHIHATQPSLLRQLLPLVLAIIGCVSLSLATPVQASRPNVLIFLVDDLGYGDLGCYGNHTIESPHIDRLAAEGTRFVQMYAPAPICTPSRAGMLTGRYPVRLGMTSDDRRFRTLNSPAQPGGLPLNETTLAEVAKAQGYRTAIVGKWHLGLGAHHEHLPMQHGFDTFFGMPVTNVQTCGGKKVYNLIGGHGEVIERSFLQYWFVLTGKIWLSFAAVAAAACLLRARRLALAIALLAVLGCALGMWYTLNFTLLGPASCLLYENDRIVEQPLRLQNVTLRNTDAAQRIIRDAARAQTPFLLYMSYVKVHTALFTAPHNAGRSRHGAYGDNIEELDWSVGEILRTLDDEGQANHTLIFFASDNGPFLERGVEAGYCGRAPVLRDEDGRVAAQPALEGPLRGAKGQVREVWECGSRVPGLVRWPGHVPAGHIVWTPASLLDIFPTLLETWGVPADTLPAPLDGRSLWPLLRPGGGRVDDPEASARVLMHYCGSTVAAVRVGRYKAVYWTPRWDPGLRACPSTTICDCRGDAHDPPLLFDMDRDPTESRPLPPAAYAPVLAEAERRRRQHLASLRPVPNQLEQLARPWLMPCCGAERLPAWKRWLRVLTGTCTCDGQ